MTSIIALTYHSRELTIDLLSSVATNSVVYDSIEPSPYYSNNSGDVYIDEKDLIELASPHASSVG